MQIPGIKRFIKRLILRIITKSIARSILDEYYLDIKITNFKGDKVDPSNMILDLKKKSVFVENLSKTQDIFIILKLKND